MSITAKDLLDKLLELQSSGLDLSELEVDCTKSVYTGYCFGEMFDEQSFSPTDISVTRDCKFLCLSTMDYGL